MIEILALIAFVALIVAAITAPAPATVSVPEERVITTEAATAGTARA